MVEKLITAIRLLLGAVYTINGFNWFCKIITPYPSMSDFAHFMPPPDIVGALIENGILFNLAKAIELGTGIALLANRMVPLSLVVAMTVTVMVFIVDAFKPQFKLRAFVMGSGSFVMNTTLLLAYLHHYRAMFAWKATGSADPAGPSPADGGAVADFIGRTVRPVFGLLAVLSVLYGLVMVTWLLVMVGQYIADPKGLYEIHKLVPR